MAKNLNSPIDTRHRFNVDTTSYDIVRRCINVETTSRVYGETCLKALTHYQHTTETTTLYDYVDDNIMYSSDKNANIVINKIRDGFATVSEWFYEKYMDLNPDKYHLLTLGLMNLLQIFFSTILQSKMLPRKKSLASN